MGNGNVTRRIDREAYFDATRKRAGSRPLGPRRLRVPPSGERLALVAPSPLWVPSKPRALAPLPLRHAGRLPDRAARDSLRCRSRTLRYGHKPSLRGRRARRKHRAIDACQDGIF